MLGFRFLRIILLVVLALASGLFALAPSSSLADGGGELYFVDAHSQMPGGLNTDHILPLMDKAGVRRTLLSARNDRSPQDVAEFATAHPGRITAAVRSKGRAFNDNKKKFRKLVKQQLKQPVFKALGEVILYHAQKGNKAPEINVSLDSPQAQLMLDAALDRKWPFIAHFELKASGGAKPDIMASFEAALRANPEHPFVLIHMAQLDVGEVKRLIADHGNVYFITSHSNRIKDFSTKQPWTNMFDVESLLPGWSKIMVEHPDRFVLGFDNVWPEDWEERYVGQAELWRKALAELPPEVAHAVAHGNAERLWNLPTN
ncbi:MAG: amidohydrolase family protein [Alphaproteobacteria bacterium]|jgi:predicted TIM-barrel fold metal-dependent hydrolase|nr:amidohydrolase family protein [Alphaproteobacteria bacterium]